MSTCGNIYSRRRLGLIVGLLGGLLLAACAPFSGEEGSRSGGKRGARSAPLAFPGDDTIVTETDVGLPDYSGAPSDTSIAQPPAHTLTANDGEQGFDVQFFASRNIQEARQVQRQADTLTTMPLRVIFEEPYYKVLAGPYPTFEEAQEFLRAVTRMGYTTAWIVARKGTFEE